MSSNSFGRIRAHRVCYEVGSHRPEASRQRLSISHAFQLLQKQEDRTSHSTQRDGPKVCDLNECILSLYKQIDYGSKCSLTRGPHEN